jgi:exosortase C (VPDSG-CTERM-specific)
VLVDVVRFALSGTLYSHIPLVPVVSIWLLWQARRSAPAHVKPARRLALALAAGATILAAWGWSLAEDSAPPDTRLAFAMSALTLYVIAAVAWHFGVATLRFAAFPLGFLVFAIPLPPSAVVAIESLLQHGSGVIARGLFELSGTAVFYHDLTFQLPGINLLVAPECSGLHSTLALLMVSLVAGFMFLRSPWHAALLSAAVLPLSLLRNGIRIFTVGELCVTRGPAMIDSPIHRNGGPLFFALSLLPLFVLLALLLRGERTRRLASPRASAALP